MSCVLRKNVVLTFSVSDNTKDSIRSARLFVLRSSIPVNPQATLLRRVMSDSMRSDGSVSRCNALEIRRH